MKTDHQTPVGFKQLPEHGVAHETLLGELRALRADDADWRQGRCFSLVYHASEAHTALLKEATSTFFAENALNPMAFRSVKQMEHEVVRMCAGLLNGDHDVVGTMTSGGTESLLLAVKTYREYARAHRPWVLFPEMVLPTTAHAAFDWEMIARNSKLIVDTRDALRKHHATLGNRLKLA